MADGKTKVSKIENKTQTERRGGEWQCTAKAYKVAITTKRQYLVSQATLPNVQTATVSTRLTNSKKDKGKQLCLRKLSLCFCRDLQQKLQSSAAATC